MEILKFIIAKMSSEEIEDYYKKINEESVYYSDLFKKNNHLKEYEEYTKKSHTLTNDLD